MFYHERSVKTFLKWFINNYPNSIGRLLLLFFLFCQIKLSLWTEHTLLIFWTQSFQFDGWTNIILLVGPLQFDLLKVVELA